MGRKPWTQRLTVEECLALDIAVLPRDFLREDDALGTYRWLDSNGAEIFRAAITVSRQCSVVRLRYSLLGNQGPLDYFVETISTKCNFGGCRWWFVCPLVKDGIACKRLVRMLYLPLGARYFGCRACNNLTYRSCQEHDSRVDALLRLSPAEAMRFLARVDLRSRLLAIRASQQLKRRLLRSRSQNCEWVPRSDSVA
jgi:hypothetical protein